MVLDWHPILALETVRYCWMDDLTIREYLRNLICFLVPATEHQASATRAMRRLHHCVDLSHDPKQRARELEGEQAQVGAQELLVLDLEVVVWVAVPDEGPMEQPRAALGVH